MNVINSANKGLFGKVNRGFALQRVVLCMLVLIASMAQAQNIVTIAGGGPMNTAGLSTAMYYPGPAVFDRNGNLYVSIGKLNQVYKITPQGGVYRFAGAAMQSYAGAYSGDGGLAINAHLYYPQGLAVDSAGNVYIADAFNNAIRKVDTTGHISTFAGTGVCGYSGDGGWAGAAQLCMPLAITLDSAGNVYIGDYNYAIRKVNTQGMITTIAGNHVSGYSGDGGPASAAQISNVYGLAFDNSGNLFLSDNGNNVIREVSASGTISTIAGIFNAPGYSGDGGPAASAQLNGPMQITVDGSGNLYFADTSNHVIRKISAGTIITVAGDHSGGYSGDGGAATSAMLQSPQGITVDSSGNLYISDSANSRIRQVATDGTIATFAGNGQIFFPAGDGGPAVNAALSDPVGVATDNNGNIYVTDTFANAVRMVNSVGAIIRVAGNGVIGYSGDGGLAIDAQFNEPQAVAVDASGNVYIADSGNFVIRKVDGNGIVQTIAGNHNPGYSGNGGPAVNAQMGRITGLAVDGSGNLYLVGDGSQVVRKVDSSGAITVVAGSGTQGYNGDGILATQAQLNNPSGVAVDSSGNLYIADQSNGSVRKVDTNGIIHTVAGDRILGYAGDGGPALYAEMTNPSAIAVDYDGVLYISDPPNNVIRQVDDVGVIHTVAGNHIAGFSGDGGLAIYAELMSPWGVAVNNNGTLYIADVTNDRIRAVGLVAEAPTFSPAPGSYTTPQTVTLSDGISGATIYYSTNGGGTYQQYTGPFVVNNSLVVSTQILAYASVVGYTNSPTTTASYTIVPAAPVFSPAPGSYSGSQTVTLSDSTSGASIFYSLNNSFYNLYTGPIVVKTGTTIYAYATASGVRNSSTVTGIYNITQATTTTVTYSPNPVNAGQTVTLTATVSVPGLSQPAPDETGVAFMDGSTTLGYGQLHNGMTTLTVSNLNPYLLHNITASYPGTTSYGSATTTYAASTGSTTLIMRSSVSGFVQSSGTNIAGQPGVFLYGTSVTFSAFVNSGPMEAFPTGTVTFFDGGTMLGTATLPGTNPSVTSITTSALSVGTHSITASYAGDSNYSGVITAPVTVTVKSQANIGFTVSPSPSTFGQAVTMTATVNVSNWTQPYPPAGETLNFLDGSTVIGTGTLNSSGQAMLVISNLSGGTHQLRVVYPGDAYIVSSQSAIYSLVVQPAVTSVALSALPNPASFGQSVTFIATVTSPAGIPPTSESITFVDGSTTLGTVTLNSSGVATFTSALAVGVQLIRASYAGDSNFSASAAAAQVTVTAASASLALGSSPNPSVAGQSVTLTATLSSSFGAPAGEPVTFLDGSTTLGTANLNSSGVATFTSSVLSAGAHSLTAVYTSDGNFAGVSSAAVAQVVQQAELAFTPAQIGTWFTDSGLASASQPGAIVSDGNGNLFFIDVENKLVRELAAGQNQIATTVAGGGNPASGNGDGGAATSALLNNPTALAIDGAGNLYIADGASVRMVSVGTISTIVTLNAGDQVFGLALGSGGNLYVADTDSGSVTATVWETPLANLSQSSPATPATMTNVGASISSSLTSNQGVALSTNLTGLTIDASGNLFVADTGNERVVKYVPGMATATTVGSGFAGTQQALATDAAGDVYVGDHSFKGQDGAVTLLAGTSYSATVIAGGGSPASGNGDGGAATSASLNPAGLAVGPTGILYVADVTAGETQGVIRGVGPNGVAIFVSTALGTTSAPQTIVINNVGNSVLSIASITSSADFALAAGGSCGSSYPINVGVGANCALTIAFTPQATGARTGTLTITDNGGASPHTVNLSGTGILEPATVSLTSGGTSVYGQAVIFTATVASSGTDSFVPTGTVTFSDGNTTLGTGTLSATAITTYTTSSLAVGTHSITASYAGDSNFGSVTGAFSQAVNQDSSSIVLTLSGSSSNPSTYGQQVSFSVTVTASTPGAGTPSGMVTFMSGAIMLGEATLTNGQATFSTTGLAGGSNTTTASYSGDTNFTSSISSGLSQTVNPASTSVALASSANPSVFGQTVILIATVTSSAGIPAAGETVTFVDGSTALGTAVLNSSGVAMLTVSNLAVGAHSITVTYPGDANFARNAGALSQTVLQAGSSIALSLSGASSNPSVYGQPVAFVVTVAASAPGAGTPSGTITFKSGSAVLGTATLSSGQATFSTTALAGGADTITASYVGDGNFSSSASTGLGHMVNPAASNVALVPSANPSTYRQAVTLTATVTSSAGTPALGETVTFVDGTTTLGTGTLNSSGVATLGVSSFIAGTHSLSVSYAGDSNFAASSGVLSQTVNSAASSVALGSAPNPSLIGQSVTLTATVTSAAGAPPLGEVVTFSDGGTTLGTGTLNGSGVATFTPSALAAGAHALKASYAGDSNFVASSGTTSQMVQAPVAALSPASLTFVGQRVGTSSAAQAVSLSNTGTSVLTISGISASGDFTQTNNCAATLASNASCTINVVFKPSATGSRSGLLTVSSNSNGGASTVSLVGTGFVSTASVSPTSLSFSAQVVGASSSSQAVTINNTGGGPLDISSISTSGDFSQTNTCTGAIASGANCTVNVVFKPTAGGSRSGSLTIASDASNGTQTVALSGSGEDFTLSASPLSITVNAGNRATYMVSIGALGGYNSSVSFSCAGAPSHTTCSISPTSNTPGKSVTVTLQSTSRSGHPGTPAGTYTITVTGTSGSLKHSANVTLKVN